MTKKNVSSKKVKIKKEPFDCQLLIDSFTRLSATTSQVNIRQKRHGRLLKTSASELISTFSFIPPQVTAVRLSNVLCPKTGESIAYVLRALPPHITSLTLMRGCLANLSPKDLQQVFQAIPPTLSYLKIHHNNGNDLPHGLTALPKTVRRLDISSVMRKSNNDFYLKIVRAISDDIEAVYIGNIRLYTRKEIIFEVFKKLKNSFPVLDLRGNWGSTWIPDLDTELTLSVDTELLLKILASAPPSLRTINLSSNALGSFNQNPEKIAQAIPKSVNELNLSYNRLYQNRGNNAITLLQNIASGQLTALNLAENGLGFLTQERLISLFFAISKQPLRSLNLKGNHFERMREDHLIFCFQRLNLDSLERLNVGKIPDMVDAQIYRMLSSVKDTTIVHLNGIEATMQVHRQRLNLSAADLRLYELLDEFKQNYIKDAKLNTKLKSSCLFKSANLFDYHVDNANKVYQSASWNRIVEHAKEARFCGLFGKNRTARILTQMERENKIQIINDRVTIKM